MAPTRFDMALCMVTPAVMNGEPAMGVIDGVGGGTIPGSDLPAFTVRRPAVSAADVVAWVSACHT